MKTIVVIPTYDEKDNVAPMAEAVLADEELALSRPSPSAPTAQGLAKFFLSYFFLARAGLTGVDFTSSTIFAVTSGFDLR